MNRVSGGRGAVPMSGGPPPPAAVPPSPGSVRVAFVPVTGLPRYLPVEIEPSSPARSGQIAMATTAAAPRASTTPATAATRSIIGWVAECADQARGDHADDQQRDGIEADRSDVAVGPQAQPRVDDHIDGRGGEEPAEDQADQKQGIPEVGIQLAQ